MTNNSFNSSPISETDLKRAIHAYGLVPDSIDEMTQGCYALVYKIQCGGKDSVVRIRNEMANASEVIFARKWGQAVCREVIVPVPLAPLDIVPVVAGRCVEIAPYIEHEHSNGGHVGPEAWITVGEWVGRMHRLGTQLSDEAPVNLPYGNYPHDTLMNTYLTRAWRTVPGEKVNLLMNAEELFKQSERMLQPYQEKLTSGVVHGDMHFWNVLYAKGEPVAIIDLDFLQQGILISDIAYACIWLDAWESERGGEWRGVMRRYLTAYEDGRQKPLSVTERESLPWLRVRTHIFFFLCSVQISWSDVDEEQEDLKTAESLVQRQ
jgi:Ser/Thr protein kinase RdoA (MazF antagonist)